MKTMIRFEKEEQQFPKSRGQVAQQEQMRILREALPSSRTEGQQPNTRGQVAQQEQMRILREALPSRTKSDISLDQEDPGLSKLAEEVEQ